MLASALVVLTASLATTGAAVAGPIGWAVGNNGTILHTTDGGMNWASQTSGTSEHLRTVTFMPAAVAVSEPATFVLFLLGLLALAIPTLRRSV